MPVAKPKHIKARSDKVFKSDPGEYYNPDVMSENMYALLEHLKKRGAVGEVYAQHAKDKEDLGVGGYIPADKGVAVIAHNPRMGGKTLAHEITHALNWSDLESKEQRIRKLAEEDPEMVKKLVFPSSWERGEVAAPLTERFLASFAQTPENSRDKIVSKMFNDTAINRTNEVRKIIPPGESWSGLRELGNKEHIKEYEEEGQAYYLTSPHVAKPMSKRAKEFGMFLRSYNVPMDIVAPLVEEMSGLKVPSKKWVGGTNELNDLIKRENRRRTLD
jgi:hypothetical protein